GASEKIAVEHKTAVEQLGKIIVENGFSLVYGAGATGCMGAVAHGVRKADGYVMGITPHFIKKIEGVFDCDNTIMVDTMAERKMLMEKHADIFIVAPGGVGTMSEFFQVLDLKYLGRLSQPIIVLNLDGFYDGLMVLIESLIKNNAVYREVHSLFEVVTSVDDEKLVSILKNIKK
ncbi:MAG: TIGR00730 family Rossman fold protein, partial [Clostridia bacterium]|nr:TIGR00730 family Rossman fold protein [Clostridia bacterium]